jgi:RNA polymerase sigma factor (sigma-70 family)
MTKRSASAVAGAETPIQLDPLGIRLRQLLSDGDLKGAATQTIRGYGPELLRFLRGLLGNESDAEEAFARASERIWRSLPEFRGDSELRTWCFRLAWSAAADLRKEAWNVRRRRLETAEGGELAAADGTATWLRHERLRLSLNRLRAALTLEEQGLLQLRIDQQLSWDECAQVLALDGPVPRVNSLVKRFERIKSKLRALADEAESG